MEFLLALIGALSVLGAIFYMSFYLVKYFSRLNALSSMISSQTATLKYHYDFLKKCEDRILDLRVRVERLESQNPIEKARNAMEEEIKADLNWMKKRKK